MSARSLGWVPLVVLTAGLSVGAGHSTARPESGAPRVEVNSANMAAPVPAPGIELGPQAPLDRERLLMLVYRARSAAAAGTDDREVQAAFDGTRFTFRIRLGCTFDPASPPGSLTARFDRQARRVELSAAPDIDLDQPVVAQVAGSGFEAAEGLWVPQPWLLEPACTTVQTGQAPSVGLVQFFTADDARTSRRQGRAYVAREELPEDASAPVTGSWDLVLSGRLQKLPDERVIECRSAQPGAAPACIVSVRFDSVAIENIGTGARLAEWRGG